MEESKKHKCHGCGGCGHHDVAPEPEIIEAPDWQSIAKYKAAELDNYIKRTRDAVQGAYNDGRTHVVMMMLPLGDSLGEAIKTVKNDADREGLEILIRKFDGILESLGMEEIKVKVGDKFDPHIHSCISQASDDNNKILEVWQKGYRFGGRVIRPAMVKI